MSILGPPLLSFLIGFVIALAELITSKYPRTFFVLEKCWKIYVYSLIYGAISFFLMLSIKSLIGAKIVELSGPYISNVWVQAVIVGIVTKALLHIRLFSVGINSRSIPIGIETLILLFEPWFLREIMLDEFNGIRDFIENAQTHYNNLDKVKEKIKQNIPSKLPRNEKYAFLSDLSEKERVADAMEHFLQNFGKSSFERVFPMSTD